MQSRRHWEALVGLALQNNSLSLPKWNLKQYKSVEFCQFLESQAALHECKDPYWRLSGDGSVWMSVLKPEITGKHYEKSKKKQQATACQKNTKSRFLHLVWQEAIPLTSFRHLRHVLNRPFPKISTTKFRPENRIRT